MTKEQLLKDALGQIEKQFGEGTIMRLGDNASMEIDTISTGSIALDIALGVGGLPKGRVCEIYGPESSGKTTLALHVVAEAQKLGGSCAFIDAEHALDPIYAEAIGCDVDNLLVSQPDTGEQALTITNKLYRVWCSRRYRSRLSSCSDSCKRNRRRNGRQLRGTTCKTYVSSNA